MYHCFNGWLEKNNNGKSQRKYRLFCKHDEIAINICSRFFLFFMFSLIISAFMTCVGMTFLILACAVPTKKIFYPFFVLLFYVLSVIPMLIAKRLNPGSETNAKTEFALFITAGMVLSAFALPIVLAHTGVVSWHSHPLRWA